MFRTKIRSLLRSLGVKRRAQTLQPAEEPAEKTLSGRIYTHVGMKEIRLLLPKSWRPPSKARMLTISDVRSSAGETPQVLTWQYSSIVEQHSHYVLQPEEGAAHAVDNLTFDQPVDEVEITVMNWHGDGRLDDVPAKIAWYGVGPDGLQTAGWLELT